MGRNGAPAVPGRARPPLGRPEPPPSKYGRPPAPGLETPPEWWGDSTCPEDDACWVTAAGFTVFAAIGKG